MATRTLQPTKLQPAGYYRESWEVICDGGTELEDLLRPDYWLHVSKKLRRMSLISVLSEDETWFAELIVLNSGLGFAKVKLLRHVEFYDKDERPAEENIEYETEVAWKGPHSKWRVSRKNDGHVLKEGFAGKEDALRWQRNHEQMIARVPA